MEVVACPACGQANSLPVGMSPAEACCASCGELLEREEPARYYIAQGQDVQGPYERASVLQWIRQGRVRPDMMFCVEGTQAWVSGHDCPDLFPHLARAPAPVRRAPAPPGPEFIYAQPEEAAPVPRSLRHDLPHAQHAHHRAPAPGGVIFAAVLDFIEAVLCIWFVVGVAQLMQLASSLSDTKIDQTPYIVPMLVGGAFALGYIVLGLTLLRGSNGARIVQYVLCGISILVALLALTRGADAGKIVPALHIAVAVLVIVMISTPEASDFFAQGGRAGGRRRGPARGAYRRRPRRRRRY